MRNAEGKGDPRGWTESVLALLFSCVPVFQILFRPRGALCGRSAIPAVAPGVRFGFDRGMRLVSSLSVAALLLPLTMRAAEPKPVPLTQAIPQAHDQVSFERNAVEIARYHY